MRFHFAALLALLVCLAPTGLAHAQSQERIEKGKQIYDDLCEACHGPYGRGNGPVADQLTRRPPDLTNPAYLGSRSDDEIVANLMRTGQDQHTPMVMAQVVKEEAIRNALAYMRTLAVPGSVLGESVSVKAGRDLYRNFCWMCHGQNGDGQGPAAANIPGIKPRDFTSPEFVIDGREQEIFGIIQKGAAASFHGSEYMLEWGNKLSPQQIRDLIAYLKTLKSGT